MLLCFSCEDAMLEPEGLVSKNQWETDISVLSLESANQSNVNFQNEGRVIYMCKCNPKANKRILQFSNMDLNVFIFTVAYWVSTEQEWLYSLIAELYCTFARKWDFCIPSLLTQLFPISRDGIIEIFYMTFL